MRLLLAPILCALMVAPAAAEVRFSGDARMGMLYDSSDGGLRLVNRLRIGMTLQGTTDGGIDYGFTLQLDEAAQAARGTGGTVKVRAGRHSLSFGDVDSALLPTLGRLHSVGMTGLGDGHRLGF